MPKFTWSKWRVLIPALIAGFFAIMCAGPGILILPASARLTERIVCPQGANIEYRRVRYSYHRPGESTLEINCVDQSGKRSEDVAGPVILTLFGIYFVPFFVLLLFLTLTAAARTTPPEQLPRLEQEAEREVRDLLTQGRKIDAIRRVRELTRADLKQAKDYVDSLSNVSPLLSLPRSESEPDAAEHSVKRLKTLKEMMDAGLITEQEYEAKKGEILSRM